MARGTYDPPESKEYDTLGDPGDIVKMGSFVTVCVMKYSQHV